MSKIGKMPVELPDGVSVSVDAGKIIVKGPKGELSYPVPRAFEVKIEGSSVICVPQNSDKKTRAMYGTLRMLIANAVTGVKDGWKRELELVGTGYRARIDGKNLELNVGFSHPIIITPPEEVAFGVEKTIITVEGIDKQVVGQITADIRKVRPPEPYKGKGIRYKGEQVRRKAGKAAKTAGAA